MQLKKNTILIYNKTHSQFSVYCILYIPVSPVSSCSFDLILIKSWFNDVDSSPCKTWLIKWGGIKPSYRCSVLGCNRVMDRLVTRYLIYCCKGATGGLWRPFRGPLLIFTLRQLSANIHSDANCPRPSTPHCSWCYSWHLLCPAGQRWKVNNNCVRLTVFRSKE